MRTLAVFLLLTLGISPVAFAIQQVSVTFSEESQVYSLSWENASGPISISVSAQPGEAGDTIARRLSAGEFSWPLTSSNIRHYFTLNDGEHFVEVATRVLPLEGGRNFRDLGGYKTNDGKSVRWGKVFRSGTMTALTLSDYEYLSGIGVKVVCDFRSAGERKSEPTTWSGSNIDYLTFRELSVDGANPLEVLAEPDVSPERVAAAMADGYWMIALQHKEAYARMFDEIAANRLPLVFNCSAGKDRTGISAALILSALGVPRDQVVADYAMSEQIVDYMAIYLERDEETEASSSPYAFLQQMPPALLQPLMRSDPRYIETALDDIEREYGSIRQFLADELKVDDQKLARIRANLLQ